MTIVTVLGVALSGLFVIGTFTAYGPSNTCSQHSGTTATVVDDKEICACVPAIGALTRCYTRAKRVGSSKKMDGRPLYRIDTRLPGPASSTNSPVRL
jgi:hypothetical protein